MDRCFSKLEIKYKTSITIRDYTNRGLLGVDTGQAYLDLAYTIEGTLIGIRQGSLIGCPAQRRKCDDDIQGEGAGVGPRVYDVGQ
jgi:hypothetical protein